MVKEPATEGGREIDQKQLEISNFVKKIGEPEREVSKDSNCGREKEGGLPYDAEKKELNKRKSHMRRAFSGDLYVRKVGEPKGYGVGCMREPRCKV